MQFTGGSLVRRLHARQAGGAAPCHWCSTCAPAYRHQPHGALQWVCACAGSHPACGTHSLAMLHPAMSVHPAGLLLAASWAAHSCLHCMQDVPPCTLPHPLAQRPFIEPNGCIASSSISALTKADMRWYVQTRHRPGAGASHSEGAQSPSPRVGRCARFPYHRMSSARPVQQMPQQQLTDRLVSAT